MIDNALAYQLKALGRAGEALDDGTTPEPAPGPEIETILKVIRDR